MFKKNRMYTDVMDSPKRTLTREIQQIEVKEERFDPFSMVEDNFGSYTYSLCIAEENVYVESPNFKCMNVNDDGMFLELMNEDWLELVIVLLRSCDEKLDANFK